MIQEFIERFDKKREELRKKFSEKHVENYNEVVKLVVEAISGEPDGWKEISPDRIHKINDGESGYQPSTYWYVRIAYGSCSGCDTLERIKSKSNYDDNGNIIPPTTEQVDDYMMLALHVVQGIKKMDGEEA